jgi:hypothetical protein
LQSEANRFLLGIHEWGSPDKITNDYTTSALRFVSLILGSECYIFVVQVWMDFDCVQIYNFKMLIIKSFDVYNIFEIFCKSHCFNLF